MFDLFLAGGIKKVTEASYTISFLITPTPIHIGSNFQPFIFIYSTKDISLPLLGKRKFTQKNLSTVNQNIQGPQYSDSVISDLNINRQERNSFNKDFSKQSSIYSNDHHDSSSSSIDNITIGSRPRTQLTNLLSLDFVQSSANFIYPNVRFISSGYFFNRNNDKEKNSIYIFSNTLSLRKNIPLVFLGNEFFNCNFLIKFFNK
jgi:hypothetical protein